MDLAGLRERLTKLDAELARADRRAPASFRGGRARKARDRPPDARLSARARRAPECARRRGKARLVAGARRQPVAPPDPRLARDAGAGAGRRAGAGQRPARARDRRRAARWAAGSSTSSTRRASRSRSRTRPGRSARRAHRADWQSDDLSHDVIVVATPLGITAAILEQLARARPPGLVFDIGSLKSPLRAGLEALRQAGVRVTSVHPMFGPDTELLSGRHVIFVDVGRPDAAPTRRACSPRRWRAGRHDARRPRSADRLRARPLARAQHRVLHRARRERRGGAAARAAVVHDVRRAARGRLAGRGREPGPLLRDPGAQRLRHRIARGAGLRRDAAAGAGRDQDAAGFARLMRRGQAYLQDRAAARQT